jgi:hypothetical protein
MGIARGAAQKRIAAATIGAALAALLSACGTAEEASRFVVSPGKYEIYTCQQIADQMQKTQSEVARLEGLLARAGQGQGGQVIGEIAYGPDYLANTGDLRELRRSAAAKNCANVPGAPQARASDTSIR